MGVINSKAVETEMGRRTTSALKRFGAFVRRRAMSSLRYRKKKSAPGSPPSAHRSTRFTRLKTNKKTGEQKRQPSSPLRELIAFAVVDGGKAVIVGPMIFRSSSVGGGNVPPLLEKGGAGTFMSEGKRKTGRWAPRPTMGPAFKAELP